MAYLLNWRAARAALLAAACGLVLAACGGGSDDGGGGGDPPAPPSITTQPQPASVNDGAAASFNVAASGNALGYQWQKNQADITGATQSTLNIAAAPLADNGARFRVVVSNSAGSVTSNEATLVVNAVAPTITTAPAAATVVTGGTATFAVTAAGSAPLAYQWLRDGNTIAGATAASYTTPTLVVGDSGATFAVLVSNGAGTLTSAAARLTVQTAPAPLVITAQPQAASVSVGASATFAVAATGEVPLTYQWRRSGADIAGATGASYTTPAATLADNGTRFTVRVGDASGASLVSVEAPLSVTPAAATSNSFALSASFTLVRRADGSVVGWGNNSAAQLGSGPLVAGSPGRLVAQAAVAIAAGDEGGVIRKAGGMVDGWGTNAGGWLGGTNPGAPAVYATPVAIAWPQTVSDLTVAVDTFDSTDFTLALLADGTVWQLPGTRSINGTAVSYAPNAVTGVSGVVALASGHGPAHVIQGNGTVWKLVPTFLISGDGRYDTSAEQVVGLTGVRSVTCGRNHCLALLVDGRVLAWGEGRSGELGNGASFSSPTPVVVSGLSNVSHIAVTSNFGTSFARTADGRVFSWGRGELSARPSVRTGALFLPPPNSNLPLEVASLIGSTELACSDRHCAARSADGTVWTWGDNLYRQLGVGTAASQEPVQVPGINLN